MSGPAACRSRQADAGEPTGHQVPQELGPSRSVLAGQHVEAQDLPVPVGVYRGGDDRRDVGDATALPALQDQGVDTGRCRDRRRGGGTGTPPRPRPGSWRVRRPGTWRCPRCRACAPGRQPGASTPPSRSTRPPRRRAPARPAGGAPGATPGSSSPTGAWARRARSCRCGCRRSWPVAVAPVHSIGRALAVQGAARGVGLRRHEGLDERADHLPQQIGVGFLEVLAEPDERVHSWFDHRAPPLRVPWSVLDEDGAVVFYFKDPQVVRTPRPRTLSIG